MAMADSIPYEWRDETGLARYGFQVSELRAAMLCLAALVHGLFSSPLHRLIWVWQRA